MYLVQRQYSKSKTFRLFETIEQMVQARVLHAPHNIFKVENMTPVRIDAQYSVAETAPDQDMWEDD